MKYLKKKKYEVLANKFKNVLEFFKQFSDITKEELAWPDIKTKGNKIKGIGIKVYFVKYFLGPKQIGMAWS